MRYMPYKFIMNKSLLVFLLFLAAAVARADIDATWSAKKLNARINTIESDDIEYVSLNELSEFLGCDHNVDIRRGAGSLELDNGELNYT